MGILLSADRLRHAHPCAPRSSNLITGSTTRWRSQIGLQAAHTLDLSLSLAHDVATVFKDGKSVNAVLRSILKA